MTEIIDLEMSAESAAAGQVEIAVPKRSARLASITGFFSRRAAAMDSPSVSVVWQHDAVIVRSPVWFPFIPIPTALRLFETPRKR